MRRDRRPSGVFRDLRSIARHPKEGGALFGDLPYFDLNTPVGIIVLQATSVHCSLPLSVARRSDVFPHPSILSAPTASDFFYLVHHQAELGSDLIVSVMYFVDTLLSTYPKASPITIITKDTMTMIMLSSPCRACTRTVIIDPTVRPRMQK